MIELLVVSAIIIVITTFILLQQSKFNSSTLLRSLTYSVALTVRQAQIYGTSVRGFTPQGGAEVFASGYGVNFTSGTPTQYTLFADLPGVTAGNGSYDSGEALPIFMLGSGYSISQFCAQRAGGSTLDCTSGTATLINSLTIYFRRPNPDACFSTNAASGACAQGAAMVYDAAYIQIQSGGNGDTRHVKISSTGQISVCKPNIPVASFTSQC